MFDLELLHNFTISTYTTLSNEATIRQLWRVVAPQMGFRCDYLMRCILAVSALHMAVYRPQQRDFYTAKALEYHQHASRAAMQLMSDVALDDAETLFLFSVLTIYFGELLNPNSGQSLIQAVGSVFASANHLDKSWVAHGRKPAFFSSARAVARTGCVSYSARSRC
jgi:hypothetical protein